MTLLLHLSSEDLCYGLVSSGLTRCHFDPPTSIQRRVLATSSQSEGTPMQTPHKCLRVAQQEHLQLPTFFFFFGYLFNFLCSPHRDILKIHKLSQNVSKYSKESDYMKSTSLTYLRAVINKEYLC